MTTINKIITPIISSALILFLSYPGPLFAQESGKPAGDRGEDLQEFMEEGMKEISYYSLDELLNVEVEVASLFSEDELVVGSSVSSISGEKMKNMGVRRTHEAFMNDTSIITVPFIVGAYITSIRGYTSTTSLTGIATLLDGVPMNEISTASSSYALQNWEAGTLKKIELIKGPGSAIYGSDAFHGVISLMTYESERDEYNVEAAGAYPMYYEGSFGISQGMYNNFIRIDASASASGQGDTRQEYSYPDAATSSTKYSERSNKYDSESGVLKISIKPSDKLKFKIGSYIGHFKNEESPSLYSTAFNLEDKDTSAGKSLFIMNRGSALYLPGKGISVELSSFYWFSKNSDEIMVLPDTDFLPVNIAPGGAIQTFDINPTRFGVTLTVKQPDNDLNLQWLIAYSFDQSRMYDSDYEVSAVETGAVLDKGEYKTAGLKRDINSVFGQVKWGAINRKLYIIGGGRVDNYSDFGTQFTPRGSIIFLPFADSSIKALYGRAFRAPNGTETEGVSGLVQMKGNPDMKPETIDIYELALINKTSKSKFNITSWYSYWKNGIIAERVEGDPVYNSIYENKTKSYSYGAEINTAYSIFQNLMVELGFTYMKSVALDAEDMDNPDKKSDVVYTACPIYSGNLGIYYTLKTFDINFYLNNRFYFGMKDYPSTANPGSEDLPPYYRVDMDISKVVAERLTFHLNIRNMLNRENSVPSVVGAEGGYEEPGISVLLRAGYRL